MRLNAISIEKDEQKTNVKFEEFKMFTLNDTGDYYTCIRTEDIDNFKVFINTIQLDKVEKRETSLTVSLLNTITTFWSTNFHYKVVLLMRDVQDFWCNIQTEFNLQKSQINSKKSTCNTLIMKIVGKFDFHIEINKDHNAKLALDRLVVSKTSRDFDLENTFMRISIDSSEIFNINGIKLNRIHENEMIRLERADTEQFVLDWNETWSLSIDLFKVVFPYEHNYAEAIQTQFFSIVKWLKSLHNIKKEKFTSSSPLPRDLLIDVR